jgi:O-antigen/teichoic acid export membrane protein
MAVGLQRVLIIDPLLIRIRTASRSAHAAVEAALTTTVSGAVVLTLLGVGIGLTASGTAARALLVFAPWVVPVLAHALLKAWLYREGRPRVATASSAAWLALMSVAVLAGLRSTDWQITAAWGVGACGAAIVAAVGMGERVGIAGARSTLEWFRREALGIGAWTATSSLTYSAADYARVAGISSILGPAALGGYRAIETLFAPTTLIGPAFMSAGLPALRRAVEEREAARAWSLALKISGFATGLVLAYVVAVALLKDPLIRLFGAGFAEYEYLILPVVVTQLFIAVVLGFGLLVVAARRVRLTALITILHAVVMLGLALPLAATRGLEAAAWGVALAWIPTVLLVVMVARRTVATLSGDAPGRTEYA